MMQALAEAYREEAQELLVELETALLALEEAPADMELVGRIFRALHTIKGSGAMFGFDAIAAFTHEVETVFDLVRNGQLTVSKPLIDLTLATGDQIRAMLEGDPSAANGGEAVQARCGQIIAALHALVPGEGGTDAQETPQETMPVADEDAEPEVTYRINLRPHGDIFSRGTNPLLLLNELRSLGECIVIAYTEAIPDLEDINPEKCHTSWDVLLTTSRGIDAIKDVFIFAEDDCELTIKALDGPGVREAEGQSRKLGEILVDRGYLAQEELEKALGEQRRLGELLIDKGLIDTDRIESALAEQQHLQTVCRRRQQDEQSSTVRVPAERLDILVNLVGELVTVQARLSQTVVGLEHPELHAIAEEVERLIVELRDNTMSIRMVPIGRTFSKLKRLVRDLSNELGKEVVLVTEGADTELDKTVIERLSDPLVHLIRNSIDHGIESPEARAKAGKTGPGTVHLRAMHSGANVLIEIEDDGAGLDVQRIRDKALDRGLIAEDAELSEKEHHALIFAPGFSTAQAITNVSGRGVGMDVVKQSIEALRGSIDIISQQGIGTTFTLKLPLTLAIIDGLLVQIGNDRFVLPLSAVEECIELTRQDVARAHGRQISYVRGEIVPYIRLRDRFGINDGTPDIEQIVIADTGSGKAGFVVDKVIGEHQTVIKNLGKMYRDIPGIAGATILGDGTVALIVDVVKLLESVELQETLTQ